jgi:hypothetical protein
MQRWKSTSDDRPLFWTPDEEKKREWSRRCD